MSSFFELLNASEQADCVAMALADEKSSNSSQKTMLSFHQRKENYAKEKFLARKEALDKEPKQITYNMNGGGLLVQPGGTVTGGNVNVPSQGGVAVAAGGGSTKIETPCQGTPKQKKRSFQEKDEEPSLVDEASTPSPAKRASTSSGARRGVKFSKDADSSGIRTLKSPGRHPIPTWRHRLAGTAYLHQAKTIGEMVLDENEYLRGEIERLRTQQSQYDTEMKAMSRDMERYRNERDEMRRQLDMSREVTHLRQEIKRLKSRGGSYSSYEG